MFGARVREARAAIRFNRAAQFPTISTAPSAAYTKTSDYSPSFPPKIQQVSTGDFVLPFDLSYELDLWGRVRRSVAAAREEAQASAGDYETAKLSLEAELAMDYFELRSAGAQKQLLDNTVKAYNDNVQLTTHRFKGGAGPRSDVAQAQTQLDTTRVQDSMSPSSERNLSTPSPFSLVNRPPNSAWPKLRSTVSLPPSRRGSRPTFCSAGRISPPRKGAWRKPISRSVSPERLIFHGNPQRDRRIRWITSLQLVRLAERLLGSRSDGRRDIVRRRASARHVRIGKG